MADVDYVRFPGDYEGRLYALECDLATFRCTWEWLARRGLCDALGGAESGRVWEEYVAAGYPLDVEEFIVDRANLLPE